MTDDNQSEGKEEAVPTSPEPAAEPVQEPEAPEEKPVEPEGDLPEGASTRTKEQFEKLKGNLATKEQELVAERAKNTQGSSMFDQFNPPAPVQEQPSPFQQPVQPQAQPDQLVGDDGTVDIQGLNQRLDATSVAEQSALQARDDILRIEQNRQNSEAVDAFPQLDPQSQEFDEDFYNMTSAAMAQSMINRTNKTLKQVANEVHSFRGSDNKVVKEAKKEAVKDFKEGQENRQQGPINEGAGEERQPDVSDEDLRTATRVGTPEEKDKALDIRLKSIDII